MVWGEVMGCYETTGMTGDIVSVTCEECSVHRRRHVRAETFTPMALSSLLFVEYIMWDVRDIEQTEL